MVELIMELYNYASNLRKKEYFDSSMKYYKNYLSYVSNDENVYFELFLASIKCPNDDVSNYLVNIDDTQYFRNLVALKSTEKDKILLLDEYVDYIVNIIRNNHNQVDLTKLFAFSDELLSYYPNDADESLIKSLEKLSEVLLLNEYYEKAYEYFGKLLIFSNESDYYWGRLLASNNCSNNEQLSKKAINIETIPDYINAIDNADSKRIPIYIDVKNKCMELYRNFEQEKKRHKELEIKQSNIKEKESENGNEKFHAKKIKKHNINRKKIHSSSNLIKNFFDKSINISIFVYSIKCVLSFVFLILILNIINIGLSAFMVLIYSLFILYDVTYLIALIVLCQKEKENHVIFIFIVMMTSFILDFPLLWVSILNMYHMN